MRTFSKISITMLVSFVIAIIGIQLVNAQTALTTVNLGTAESFAVLAGTEITNIPTSIITGDVGLSPASGSNYAGLTAEEVTGTIYSVDASGPAGSVNNPDLLTQAKNDLTTAYLDAAGRTPTQTFTDVDNQLGGQTLTSGVYAFGNATTANITAESPLILDAQGDPNAVFIFQASSDLVTASGSEVRLINGAQSCYVFWQVTSSATLGTGSTFVGTIMALTSISATTDVTVYGRLLARNAAVTLDSDTITSEICVASATTTTTTDTSTDTTAKLPGTNGTTLSTKGITWNIVILVLAGISTLLLVLSRRETMFSSRTSKER